VINLFACGWLEDGRCGLIDDDPGVLLLWSCFWWLCLFTAVYALIYTTHLLTPIIVLHIYTHLLS
jgi:hypothetical protein